MAPQSLSQSEERVINEWRKLRRTAREYTLTIAGFQRAGKAQLVIEPKPRLYLEHDEDLSLAIDD